MDTEAKIIIAFLFNRSGKTVLTESEIYLPLSMELGWLSTTEAQEFVRYSIKEGLLLKNEGGLHPTFPLENITIPVGFRPSKNLFLEKNKNQKDSIADRIIVHIHKHTHLKPQQILEEIIQEENEKMLLREVAALYVARKHDLIVTEWYDHIESILLKRNIR